MIDVDIVDRVQTLERDLIEAEAEIVALRAEIARLREAPVKPVPGAGYAVVGRTPVS